MANRSIDVHPSLMVSTFPFGKLRCLSSLDHKEAEWPKQLQKNLLNPNLVIMILGPIAPSKNMKPMQRHHMLWCNHSMIMIYLGSSIAHRPRIYGNVWSPYMKALHKWRKQKLICLIQNMIDFICLTVNQLMKCLSGFLLRQTHFKWSKGVKDP